MAADRGVRLNRLDGARLFRRDRPAQYQTTDGLFLDRPHGLCAGGARRRHAGGRAGRAGLYDDLCCDDARRLRGDPVDAARRHAGRDHRRSRGSLAHAPDRRVPARHLAVLARRHSAARGLLRQVLRLPRRHQGRALSARGDRRRYQRDRRLLLSGDRQAHVFRRAGARLPAHAAVARLRAGDCRADQRAVLRLSGAAAQRGHRGGEVAILTRGDCALRVISKSGHRFSDKIARTKMNRDATDLAGVRHIKFETLGSTNAEALKLARNGERGPLWITARTQSAGRGRRGSQWVSPPGNLYASLLLSEPSPTPLASQLSFVAALPLHDAVAECAPQLGPLLKVKWPNDPLIGSAKVAGILIEGESEGVFSVVIGFGVNCATHPGDTAYPATDLLLAGALVVPDGLFVALSAAIPRR